MKRNIDGISAFNPPQIGDEVELDGETWVVGKSTYGWALHAPGDRFTPHPVIKDIFGLTEFISALLQAH